jgi:WD40 repeat protein/serine/threonine protein kinase
MNGRKQRVEAVFQEAIELSSSAEREAYLERECAGEAELRREVEELLSAAVEAETVFKTRARPPALEQAGDRIGHYRLLQKIGEGGCGVVYMADQEAPVRRKVALKIVKLGMDTRQVIARFEAERQALALMDHPNIAKVLDAGATETGRPYFVMELVRGKKITAYCDQQKLSMRQRLDLFIQVCHAVQHAHQKGIIHRDIKPSNILVTERDGVPVPKVIDFGIAKATGDLRLTDKTLFTAFEQFLGTPAYMSPEQARSGELDIDTRTDIYSLGVLLYELLTGKTPFDTQALVAAGLDEMRRIIRENEPAKPSTRLTTLDAGELASAASNRQVEGLKLVHLIRGDLDWIVMKALEKDRTRRYETANGLGMDVRRYLDQEPVVARPPTTAYRIQKFVRRNRLMVVGAGLVTSALVIGLGIASWMYLREAEARQRALAAETKNKNLAEVEKDLRLKAEEQTRMATSMRLAAQSQSLRSQMPVLSALLATEAVEATRSHQKPVLPVAHESLFYALESVGGRALPGHELPLALALSSPDGHWLVTAGQEKTARLWDLTAEKPWSTSYRLQGHEASVTVAAFSPNAQLLVTGSNDGTARLWHLDRPLITNSTVLIGDRTPISQLVFSPSGRWLATESRDERQGVRLIVCDLNAGNSTPKRTTLVEESEASSRITKAELIVTSDGPWLVAPNYVYPYDGGLRLWDLTAPDRMARSLTSKATYPAAISPNRHWLSAVIRNERQALQLLLWDLRQEVRQNKASVLVNEVSGSSPIDFSDDDRFLAIGNGNIVYIWDLNSEEPNSAVRHLRGHASQFRGITMSHDGHWLASGHTDGTVQLWDLFTGGLEPVARILSGHTTAVLSLVFSPDGRWLATGSSDKTARVWQLPSSQDSEVTAQVLRGHEGDVALMAISPDSRWLVTAGYGDPVPRLWDLGAKSPGSVEVILRTSGIGMWFERKLFLSPDGHRLAARGKPGRVWNLNSDDPANTGIDLPIPREESSPVRISDPLMDIVPRVIGNRWLVTDYRKNDHRKPSLWDLKAKDPAASQQPLLDSTGPICISSDDKWLAVASSTNIQLWDLTADIPATSVSILRGSGSVTSAAISPDNRWLVAGSADHAARLWDLTVRDPDASARTLIGHSKAVSPVIFSGDSRWLFTASIDNTVRVWDLQANTPDPFRVLHLGEAKPRRPSIQSLEVTVSPNGRWVATGMFGEEVLKLWDLSSPNSSDTYRAIEGPNNRVAVFSPDSRWLITAADGTATLWNLSAGQTEEWKRTLHGQFVGDAAAFSPDARWLATAGLDGTTRLWDLHSSTLTPVVLRGHTSSVRAVQFTADGRWLVTASDDTTARLWDMDLDRLLAKVRSQAGRDFTPEERGIYYLEPRRTGNATSGHSP